MKIIESPHRIQTTSFDEWLETRYCPTTQIQGYITLYYTPRPLSYKYIDTTGEYEDSN
jgi:hypothetical protein